MHRTTIKKGGGLGAAPVAFPPIEETEALVRRASRAELPVLIGELARLSAMAQLRLLERHEDRLVSAGEAFRLTGLSRATLYRRADELPFARRAGRSVRFSLLGIEEWQRGKEEEVR